MNSLNRFGRGCRLRVLPTSRAYVQGFYRQFSAVASNGEGLDSKSSEAEKVKSVKPWEKRMSDEDFELMADILQAPSPVNMEASMINILRKETQKFALEDWKLHSFKSSAGLVVDTNPEVSDENDKLTCMVAGHADKIRLQVKSVGSDGKIYIESDAHIPITLLGNEVTIFSQNRPLKQEKNEENDFRTWRKIEGATVEAFGAIHCASPQLRSGQQGLKAEQLYLELGIHGDRKKEQVVDGLGVRPGDNVLMQRRIKRKLGRNSFSGSHLDNGLGCFVTHQLSKLFAAECNHFENLRMLFTFCTHEEIGRFGSRQLASMFKPDVLIAVDVNHDYVAAPGVGDKHFQELTIGKGPTLSNGSVCSPYLSSIFQETAERCEIPLQLDVRERDTGTDAMAGVLGNVDAAVASVGIPVRNMHTISELGVIDDMLATVYLIHETMNKLDTEFKNKGRQMFEHPDLSLAEIITEIPELPEKSEKGNKDENEAE